MNWQRIKDRTCFPVQALISERTAGALGLTPLDEERIQAVLPLCRGRLLDIGCGDNRLVRRYGAGKGVGSDVFLRPGIDTVCHATHVPFRDQTFDTVTFVACLNHITARCEALAEAYRVLRPTGRLIITMITPFVGAVAHWIRHRYDPDQLERGMGPNEAPGLSACTVVRLLETSGFRLVQAIPFVWWLNRIYVATKS